MKRLLCLLIALFVLAGCASKPSGTPQTPNPETPSAEEAPEPEPEPEPEPRFTAEPIWLLGPPEDPIWGGPVAVVVENSPMSRPQAGLGEADLVIELLAESEITRFLALFWSQEPDRIGPVRSARTATVAIADAYDAPFVHVGGSASALAILQTEWGPSDIDEITNAGGAFYRWREREMPHNVYTTVDLLREELERRGRTLEPVPTTPRNEVVPGAGAESGPSVVVDWHPIHQVTWEWVGDRYIRTDDGEPHFTEDGRQIAATNLVFLGVEGVNYGPDLGWTLYLDAGGPATVLSGTERWEGTWALQEGGGFIVTPSGGEVPLLAPGTTWVHLITDESEFAIQ